MNQHKAAFPKKGQKNKQSGQVAIFIALIFQVLFIFFAMLVNVGLLVHHKINLQNSVDLAAYYGAMKQADMLNAIAHENYQIHQSWKLMVFRYRHLGSFGDSSYPGSSYSGGAATPGPDNVKGTIFPAFCISYDKFGFMMPNEDYCKQSGQQTGLVLTKPPIPSYVAAGAAAILGLPAFAQLNIAATTAVNNAITGACNEKNALSYFELVNFIYAWKRDVANRKRLILTLANQMSANPSTDFNDLDGNSVFQGVEKTLMKNLTYQNLQNYNTNGSPQMKFFNSLGGTASGDQWTEPRWLADIRMYPIFFAFVSKDCSQSSITYAPYAVNTGEAVSPQILNAPNGVGAFISQIANPAAGTDYVGEPGPGASSEAKLYASSLGYERNPWYVPYVAVHAETKPQIPFSPFGSVTLKATAYAKVFGGTMGPWWGKQWNYGSPYSDTNTPNDDVVMPPRITTPNGLPNPTDFRNVPDNVRYVGDKIGTQSNLNMFTYSSVIKQFAAGAISMLFWSHLVSPTDDLEQIGTNGDMLAYANQGVTNTDAATKMRSLEGAVIAPDQWDVAYYSIEPDYYRNYYLRLKPQENKFKFPVRGDLGQRALDPVLKNYSIKEQIKDAQTFANSGGLDVKNALSYYAQSALEMLTSFKGMAPDNPIMDTVNNFGKCTKLVDDTALPAAATNGNCIAGGRSGYSVKLVDGDFLSSSDLPLGGKNTSGPLANPPTGF